MKKIILLFTLLASFFFAEHAFAYTVEKGDTMSKIAKETGLTLEELAQANPQVKNLDLIYVGQQINTDKSIDHSEPIVNTASSNTVSVPNEENASFSANELDLLARIVRAEAQSEPFEGKVAVAAVVLNRVESDLFPNSIKEVIYQPRQFQPVSNGQINKPADEESIRAVHAALTDMRSIAQGSLFFYNPTIATSRWLDSRATAVVIGQHVFKY
ncbi:cell wall hydrolase [Litchfieldia salsa]|uniref:N-acetylmuramoyl-L-alanine amidase n=1 Tax=Litchfieldia salsa TaxID=930152 RepID=A0A1H0T8E0_9BACI|nr:cell wall hydrolase [Litchfieldia salsa]SDP50312.1 N-acetylmuramoyl-L-alanine amidase [Litchfieldia salsa]